MTEGDSNTLDNQRKEPSALRTIGEVADELGVAHHVLRFWETRFPQIRPVKHRGRRYYTPEDIRLLSRIHRLFYSEGYTIKGVQKVLDGKEELAAEDRIGHMVAAKPAPKPAAPQIKNLGVSPNLQHILTRLEKMRKTLREIV